MRAAIFKCYLCSNIKTNVRDYMPCKRPDCTSRDCICTKCNEENKKLECWYCSKDCKIQHSKPPKKKRPRNEKDEIALNATRFIQVKELYDQIVECKNTILNLNNLINSTKEEGRKLKMEFKSLKEIMDQKRNIIIKEKQDFIERSNIMKSILNNDFNNINAEMYEKLSLLAKENEKYILNRAKYREEETDFKSKRRKLYDMNGDVCFYQTILLPMFNNDLNKLTNDFEGYFK